MNIEFVSFEIAKKLKEKGFSCRYPIAMYNERGDFHALYSSAGIENSYDYDFFNEYDYVCPTISQVLDWFRKEHHLHFEVVSAAYGYNLIISDTPDKGSTDIYYSHVNNDGPNDGGAWDEHKDCIMYGIGYVLDNLI